MATSKTTAQIQTEIASNFAAGQAGGITPAQTRQVLNDMSVSYLNVYRIEGFGGIDTTGVSDSTTGLQNAINAVPDGSTILFPINSTLTLSSTITISARTHLRLIGTAFGPNIVPGAASGDSASFVWNGAANGTMFDFESCFNPVVTGFRFTSNVAINTFLNFDGTAVSGVTGTAPHVSFCSFQNPTANTAYVAVYISAISTNNQENAIVSFNSFSGSGATTGLYSKLGSVNTSSSTVTCSDNPFTAGDVGKRIRITYAPPAGTSASAAIIDTTISSQGGTTAVLASGNAAFTQSNCTVHVDQAYGRGIVVGNSQNSKHHKFDFNVSNFCAVAIDVPFGSFAVNHLNGNKDDIGIRVGANVVEPCEINFFESEHNFIGIYAVSSTVPLMLRSCRMANDNQAGNGFFQLGGIVNMENCGGVSNTPATNQALIAMLGYIRMSGKGNNFNITEAQAGRTAINGYPFGDLGWVSQNEAFDSGTRLAQLGLHSNNFSHLPATPQQGMLAVVEDSSTNTWGATIAGGGGNRVLAWYNGSNWTVFGK